MSYRIRKNKALAAARAVKIAGRAGLDALLITHLPDVRYLCGFTGSNAALVLTGNAQAKGRALLFTDGRYSLQARSEAVGTRVVIEQKSALAAACAWLEASGIERCGFDPAHTSVAALATMRRAVGARLRRSLFQSAPPIVATLREVKDADELVRLRAAAALGCSLFDHMLAYIEPGLTEIAVAAELEHQARLAGAEAMSFETIVASGERSALPHGHATAARLPRRGFVTLDFGVILDGYCSDMTRTLHIGKALPGELDAYWAVLEAQEAAVASVAPGVTTGEVDEAARSVLRRAKLDRYFTHSTGHGVGLEIHEGPRIATRQTQPLAAGMVITIEPGIYIPGQFGVRIEDMVLVTPTGSEILTPSPKAWFEL